MISEALIRVAGVPGGGVIIMTMGPAGRTFLELDANTAGRLILSIATAMSEPVDTTEAAEWIERCRRPRLSGPLEDA